MQNSWEGNTEENFVGTHKIKTKQVIRNNHRSAAPAPEVTQQQQHQINFNGGGIVQSALGVSEHFLWFLTLNNIL